MLEDGEITTINGEPICDRCLIYLNLHETVEDIYCTITHELIHHCIDKHEMEDEIDEDQEEKLIYQMAWATESLI